MVEEELERKHTSRHCGPEIRIIASADFPGGVDSANIVGCDERDVE